MGLLSIFKRQANANTNVPSAGEPAPDEVQRARTRARQRLIGAAVLVGLGIIGFPLVFETQPRPIPVDIPIEVPHKDGAPPLVMPAGRTQAANSSASTAAVQPVAPSAPVATSKDKTATPEVITEAPEPAPSPAPQATVASTAPPISKAASKPAAKVAADAKEAPPKPAPEPKTATTAGDSSRAKSLLEGKPATASESGRFVVQVGAFSDASAAREVRVKAEKLGMRTYTQTVSTSSGSRIRVRVGPFASRDEADTALAKARSAGLTAVVLTL